MKSFNLADFINNNDDIEVTEFNIDKFVDGRKKSLNHVLLMQKNLGILMHI